jgi:4-alpha-glucanotransferase
MADHRRVFAIKREAARLLAERFFSEGSSVRRRQLAIFVDRKPEVLAYARFRARVDRERRDWRGWSSSTTYGFGRALPPAGPAGATAPPSVPTTSAATSAPVRAGLEGLDLDDVERLYLYWQWVTDEQLSALGARPDAYLSLDFPIGVHPGGFDAWRFPDCLVRGASLGAPPDTFFRGGQDWAAPPFHPGVLARAGLDHMSGCLRTHMRVAGSLRIDHVMGLHRQYWIPQGAAAVEGVYVRYPADLFYAVLALESRRAECMVVGEDLGTVPREVRPAMSRHGVRRTFVLQLEADPSAPTRDVGKSGQSPFRTVLPSRVTSVPPRLPRPPRLSAAMLNTHDLPPFAAYTGGSTGRDAAEQLREALLHLAASDAESLQINVEDLWLETEPQNVPGSTRVGLDWRRRCRRSLDELAADRSIVELLGEIDRTRRSPNRSLP